MSYYRHHVFICTNERSAPKQCCAQGDALALAEYAKQQLKLLGLSGRGKVRINKAGCLDRCSEGPVLVIYPEAVWYHYGTQQDIDEIIQQHVLQGRVVTRLLLKGANEPGENNV